MCGGLNWKKYEINVNCDVTIVKNCSFLVVIARDNAGKYSEAATFKCTTMDPIIAIAEVVCGKNFAKALNYSQVVVEGGCISYVESIKCPRQPSYWEIVFDNVTLAFFIFILNNS